MNNLSIINKLQEICASTSSIVQLPQIVVVGAQSSGKTSILESIVGKDFLPRGSGIVTRRPLILQLKNMPGGKDWAEFSHTGREKYEDFGKVHDEIEKETMRIAGVNKGISSEPIILKVFSPSVVDLTLVDLPGVVKVPIGDQPHDIESIVRDLLLKYISNPNAIILAITPGNTDIANSDALKIAKEVDPQFQRTIGVITKLDLITQDADIKNTLDVLNNKTFPLKLGYIGVVCRANSKNSIQDAVALEEEFFQTKSDYKSVKHLLGIKYLTQSLSEYLMQHIKSNLPSIKDSIANEIYQRENELSSLGQDNGFDRQEVLNSYVLMLVFKFANTYKEIIEGNMVRECSKFYIGGARINYIFQELFRKEINTIDPYDTLTDEDIRTAIMNTNGLKPSLFIPEGAFEVLIKQQINRLTKPSIICVKKVYEELKNIVATIDLPELHRYKKLEVKIREIMDNVLDRCLEPTNQMITNLIDIEQSYINTTHPDFLGPDQSFMNIFDDNVNNLNSLNLNSQRVNGNQRAGGPVEDGSSLNQPKKSKIEENEMVNSKLFGYPNNMRPGHPSSRDVLETCIIKNLISSYFSVVKKNINDLVPKTIMCFLVSQSKKMAEKEMVSQLYKSNDLESLLQEDPLIGTQRKQIKDQLMRLKASMEVLNHFYTFSRYDS